MFSVKARGDPYLGIAERLLIPSGNIQIRPGSRGPLTSHLLLLLYSSSTTNKPNPSIYLLTLELTQHR